MTTRFVGSFILCAALAACRQSSPSHAEAAAPKAAPDAASHRAFQPRPDAGQPSPRDGGVSDAEVLPLPPVEHLDAISKRLCAGDRHCCRIAASSAGTDRKGRSMTVIRLDRTCKQKSKEEDGENCQQIQNWLAVHTGPKLNARQLLTEECNDGYGASGMGEDRADTSRNLFSAGRSGGSGYYWSSSVDIVLDPLHVDAISRSALWRSDPDSSWEEHWSNDALSGQGALSLNTCTDDSAQGALDAGADAAHVPSGQYVLIPEVTLPPEFLAGGWKSTALGRCSVSVDGGPGGYSVYGAGQGDADASMRVLASADDEGQVLFVEISDDHWVGPGLPVAGRKWLFDDHLEIWASDGPSFSSGCTKHDQGAPRQWAIRISDGQVFAAAGASGELPQAETVLPKKGPARLRIRLPAVGREPRITVVYSDSDDGKRQKRLIATSTVVRGWAVTLGEVKPGAGTCKVLKGKLEVSTPIEKTDPDKAMYEF